MPGSLGGRCHWFSKAFTVSLALDSLGAKDALEQYAFLGGFLDMF